MPRLARIDNPGLLQHVMARGIEGKKIFRDKKDYTHFLDCLEIVIREAKDTRCYAWVLMPNHVHLLFLIGTHLSLSTIMRRLLTRYATYFNGRHKRRGHLFQNRYKSTVCDEDEYLLQVVRYIHLNPIKAKIINRIEELDVYPYTGHRVIIGKEEREWQEVDDILRYFSNDREEAIKLYRENIKDGMEEEEKKNLDGGGLIRSGGGLERVLLARKLEECESYDERILGSGSFVESILEKVQ